MPEPGHGAPRPARAAARHGPGRHPRRRPEAAVDIDIAALGGLGLAGPAESARPRDPRRPARQAPPGEAGLPAAIIPAADAARLLPGTEPAAIPGLAVPGTLDAALGELETLQLTLARTTGADLADDDPADAGPAPGARGPGVTLIAAAGQGQARPLLAGILDAGRRAGIAAVLLGAWPAGVTCQVAADGTVTAVTPPNPDLDGIRLFTLGAAEAAAIAGVLQEAGGSPPARRPRPARQTPATGSAPRPGAPRASATSPPPRPRRALPACPPRRRPACQRRRSRRAATSARRRRGGGAAGPAGPARRAVDHRHRQEVAAACARPASCWRSWPCIPTAPAGRDSEALWPEVRPRRRRRAAQPCAAQGPGDAPYRDRPARAEVDPNASGRYRLDPALIGTDLEAFGEALEERATPAATPGWPPAARAVALYRGELAEGTGYEWAEPYAETARRRALDAWTTIAEILQRPTPTRPCPPWRPPLATTPTTSTCTCGSCGCRPQRAAPRPSAARWPCWNPGSPTSASRRALRPGRPPPPCSPPDPGRPACRFRMQ